MHINNNHESRTNSFTNLLALQNMGNTCYLNSAIQLILSSNSIIESFKIIPKEYMFLKLFEDLINKRIKHDTPVANPILIKNELSQYNNFFKQTGQQDCHECLINILHLINKYTLISHPSKDTTIGRAKGDTTIGRAKGDTTIGDIYNVGYIIKSDKSLIQQSNKELKLNLNKEGYSHITLLTLGQLKSTLKCQSCNTERHTFENITDFSLSLPSHTNVDIIECIVDYFKNEVLDSLIQCDVCNTKTKTTKSLCMWRFPRNLIIHFKRYIQNPLTNGIVTYKRNNCIVDFSSELTFQDKENSDRNINYKLKSVVNHIGNNPNGGHYSTYINYVYPANGNVGWVHIDDDKMHKINENNIISQSAYILLYESV